MSTYAMCDYILAVVCWSASREEARYRASEMDLRPISLLRTRNRVSACLADSSFVLDCPCVATQALENVY